MKTDREISCYSLHEYCMASWLMPRAMWQFLMRIRYLLILLFILCFYIWKALLFSSSSVPEFSLAYHFYLFRYKIGLHSAAYHYAEEPVTPFCSWQYHLRQKLARKMFHAQHLPMEKVVAPCQIESCAAAFGQTEMSAQHHLPHQLIVVPLQAGWTGDQQYALSVGCWLPCLCCQLIQSTPDGYGGFSQCVPLIAP